MAKKKNKHNKKPVHRFRNASGGGGGGKMQKLGDTLVEAVERTAASAAGGAAASLISGFAVANDLIEPETVGLITTVGATALASRSSTKWREVFNGAAAAGTGQLVLGYMAKRALKKQKADQQTQTAQNTNGATARPAARQGFEDAYVMQMFRDMAGGLEPPDERGPDVIVVPAA